ncbi:hypothetical protein F441_14171 [Phytophthora nicotianae CJ01A1]|uniref:Uncharacterized protein n=5 Tax=Phytophthora nicotianae TaxID=4792 RepID=W2PVH6_PHYN3|nr:hypothetical protein PPTG_23559 [Phytophthora nicotianae INRA-310]ETI40311.1 hypothetical protein F443_14275 [Phytophthora nicotianae P1569]ETK80413.1 hypothetical protein L915_13911 [Phytophthora nicotianae]ETO69011.1 hypothetical protein F444_14292 [Phytophthora nicotianae P1976]ETP10130.1 hypothetical protein F441_14171 [Phytophthora nicotianae CJ01A1]ETL33838.1 hypothetical protein L916_13807 [Phytophthora nicotianae]
MRDECCKIVFPKAKPLLPGGSLLGRAKSKRLERDSPVARARTAMAAKSSSLLELSLSIKAKNDNCTIL